MTETERISVAEASDGFGGHRETGTEISLPVVELLTGRGFVTGKSGSGKSNSASVIAEKLLDNGFGLLIVDIDGEYYGLKEEYEILHAGADEECDIQITADHAEKLATLALEQNVPIILDVSSYLDESKAEEVLTSVSRSLFAKAKKQKQPFLLLVEEVHEYIPENGSVGECGRMLIKIGKRGRKHGLGICGISQRPADVKKDFITQCDWLLWHRLTWNNDTKVVGRILDNEYAEAVEDLDDGEGFLMTDWMDSVQRVQFYRKQTFDAGATPGLDDFERPDLKSVSDDLVSELQQISDEKQRREDRIAELRDELDRKNSRIGELERELQDARDLSRMAEQFVDSLVHEVKGPQPGKTERERMQESYASTGPHKNGSRQAAIQGAEQEWSQSESVENAAEKSATEDDAAEGEKPAASDETTDFGEAFAESGVFGEEESNATTSSSNDGGETPSVSVEPETPGSGPAGASWGGDGDVASTDGGTGVGTVTGSDHASTSTTDEPTGSDFSAEAVMEALNSVSETTTVETDRGRGTTREEIERSIRNDAEVMDDDESIEEKSLDEGVVDGQQGDDRNAVERDGSEKLLVRELKAEISYLPTKTRKMLAFYRDLGPDTPLNAHFSAGGDGNRTDAYAHNRRLRMLGLIEHVGRGNYAYRLRDLLRAELEDKGREPSDDDIDSFATDIESTVFSE